MKLETLIATMLSSVISFVTTLIVAHVYFNKGKGMNRMVQYLTHNIEKAMLPNIFTHFTSRPKIHLEFFDNPPDNPRRPHLTEIIFPTDKIIPGRPYTVIFRVSDEGLDFSMSSGTQLSLDGRNLIVKDEPFGFMSFELMLPKTAAESKYHLNFDFMDRARNTGAHKIELFPKQGSSENRDLISYGAC